MATPQPAEGTLKRAAEHPANVGAHDALAKRPKADVPTDEVTEAEAALYDRQIRLWGLAAQNRYVLTSDYCRHPASYPKM